jgi:crotonobetainyl-CoA:carnitine CoA-transferase CaiB-like acyl-CoA transferase
MPQPALAGVRVVEVGQFMAAPFATMQLADLGAEVIKIENPAGGDPTRGTGPFLDGESSPFLRLNRNKRSIALDLKAPAGRDALLKLLATADVLVENLRPGAMARLGLSYETVHAALPRLVYVSASGWGQDGPLAALPGLDIMAQARGGLMSITGTPDGEPVKVGVPICDLVCGMYGAMGAMAALAARERTGEGQHVDVSLYEAGVSFAIWEAGMFFATGQVGRPHGSAHQNSAPYQALRCADGWITAGAVTPKTWTAFCSVLDLTALLDDPRFVDSYTRHRHVDVLIPLIEERTSLRTTAELVASLDAAGVPCAPINHYDEVFTDAHLTEREFFWDAPHPTLDAVRQLGSPMRLSASPARRDSAGPLLGADTEALLTDLGYSTAEVRELEEAGTVRCWRP